jgi:hypothetical protein
MSRSDAPTCMRAPFLAVRDPSRVSAPISTWQEAVMAPVFAFDTTKSINDPKYPKANDTVAKLQKAFTAKNIPKAHSDKFVAALKAYNFSPMTSEANRYITKNMVAKGLAPVTNDPNVLQKAMMVALYGPQKKVLQASFDLSVHLKGNNLELQHTDCKGTKKVLLTVAP